MYCGKQFFTYPAHIKNGGGKYCSYECAGLVKRGKPSYARTEEHKEKMSKLKVGSPESIKAGKMFSKMNSSKKGKTIEEIYGEDRAQEIRIKLRKYGPENNNWKGGKAKQKYSKEFNQQMKNYIKKRDGYKCARCEITDEEARKLDMFNRGLQIHHIDYDRNNSLPDNLITLCKTCNSRANGHRNYWIELYRRMLLCRN